MADAGPISKILLASASPSISGGGCVSFSFLTSLHVTRVGMQALPGGMMMRTPEWRQPRIAPPRASTMKLTRKLHAWQRRMCSRHELFWRAMWITSYYLSHCCSIACIKIILCDTVLLSVRTLTAAICFWFWSNFAQWFSVQKVRSFLFGVKFQQLLSLFSLIFNLIPNTLLWIITRTFNFV